MYKENNPISYLGIYKIQTHWPQKKTTEAAYRKKKQKHNFPNSNFPMRAKTPIVRRRLRPRRACLSHMPTADWIATQFKTLNNAAITRFRLNFSLTTFIAGHRPPLAADGITQNRWWDLCRVGITWHDLRRLFNNQQVLTYVFQLLKRERWNWL